MQVTCLSCSRRRTCKLKDGCRACYCTWQSSTRTATTLASLATPTFWPTAIEATCVPCPSPAGCQLKSVIKGLIALLVAATHVGQSPGCTVCERGPTVLNRRGRGKVAYEVHPASASEMGDHMQQICTSISCILPPEHRCEPTRMTRVASLLSVIGTPGVWFGCPSRPLQDIKCIWV